MTNSAQHRSWTRNLSSWAALAALPIAIVFVLMATTQSAQAQTFKVLHTFTGGLDGATPRAGLTIDHAGNLYGTTAFGGTGACDNVGSPSGCGTVFRMVRTGSAWRFIPLYSFAGSSYNDGASPYGRVIFGPNGSLYGTTELGGVQEHCGSVYTFGCGTVFNLRPTPNPPPTPFTPWLETILYAFQSLADGAVPGGDLAFDQAGNLYGATASGGASGSLLGGTVFELTPSYGIWTKTTLYSFQQAEPAGGATVDQQGNIYGTTLIGGQYTDGSVYQLAPSASGWTLNTLHAFSGADGYALLAGVILDSAGNLYGATLNGQPSGAAIVLQLTPSNGGWAYNPLHAFPASFGGGPAANLFIDSAGNLYGTTRGAGFNSNLPNGSVFKLTPSNGSWIYTDLHDFTGGSDGSHPYSNVVMDAEGNLYGTTSEGGTGCSGLGCGVVWEITP